MNGQNPHQSLRSWWGLMDRVMLKAQQKDFEEKGGGDYPRDFARWYQLDYFRRPRSLKTTRFWLTLGVTALTTLICAATVLSERLHLVHQAGPVATAHAGFNVQCAHCHKESWQPLVRLCGGQDHSVANKTCNSCHLGAIHHQTQAQEPACASCHREHQGKDTLAAHVANRHCTSCHASLQEHLVPGNPTAFHKAITSFDDHPDFRPSSPGKKDEANLRFTHEHHLKLDLEALSRKQPNFPEKYANKKALECSDCHQADSQGRSMQPIKYKDHCADCHPLTVAVTGRFSEAKLGKAAVEYWRS